MAESLDDKIERAVDRRIMRWALKVAIVCIPVTSTIISIIYNLGTWGYNHSAGIQAAWNAFRGVK